MLVLSQTPGMRVQVILGDGRVGFVHARAEGSTVRLFLDFPKEVGIARVYREVNDRENSRTAPIETRRPDYSSALVGTIWEKGGVR